MEKIPPAAGAVCNGCLVYEQQGQNVVVLVDTPSWYAWLETATTFTFTGEEGTFTAHKARAGNRRGGWYWRAYRRKRGRLSRCYLGVSTNLTLAKLCEVAHRLAREAEDMPPLVSVPISPLRRTSTVILQSTITPPLLPVQHVVRPRLLALGIQARVALAQGNSERTRQILESEALNVAQFPIPQTRKAPLLLVPVRLALACGQLELALQWASTCGLHYDDLLTSPLGKSRYMGYVALARLLIARGRGHPNALALSQAQILLEGLLEVAMRTDAHGRLIEIQMLRALVFHAQGKTRQALTTLGPMLAAAEPEGYLRLFADEGEVMAHLLTRIAPFTTASPDYLQQVLAAIAPVQQGRLVATKPASRSSSFELLSIREREVLWFVAEGLSNQQIAQHLVLSLHTVKLHIKHLLTKLGATNRTQAVTRARALHILPQEDDRTSVK